jgi:hypothetical protein
MPSIEVRIGLGAVAIALIALGVVAATNVGDLAHRQARWNAIRYRPTSWEMFGADSFFYKSQYWSFRIFGGFVAFMGLIGLLAICT